MPFIGVTQYSTVLYAIYIILSYHAFNGLVIFSTVQCCIVHSYAFIKSYNYTPHAFISTYSVISIVGLMNILVFLKHTHAYNLFQLTWNI